MEAAIIIVFIVGYLAITLEHNIKIDKLIPALVMMAISWALISLGIDSFPQWFDSANHGYSWRKRCAKYQYGHRRNPARAVAPETRSTEITPAEPG